MIKQENVNLKPYNTMHICAEVENFYIPENDKELLKLLLELKQKRESYNILSGGSNVLLKDKIKYKNIIYMKEVDKTKKMLEKGKFYIGASNRIQEVIKFVNDNGYGGFEELYCLPAYFGGIIYMNAGIGSEIKPLFNISDYIQKVKVINLDSEKVEWIEKEKCKFKYRKSIFHSNKYIILGAEIELKEQDEKVSKEKIEKRIQYCKEQQEWGKGCFGTCFSKVNIRLLKIAKLLRPHAKQIKFAKKNPNWLVNQGEGTYKDTMKLIKLCMFLHRLGNKDIELEVKIFEE